MTGGPAQLICPAGGTTRGKRLTQNPYLQLGFGVRLMAHACCSRRAAREAKPT